MAVRQVRCWCRKVTVLAIAMWVGAAGSALAVPIIDPRPVIETLVGTNDFETFGPDTSYPPGSGAGLVGFSDTFLLANGDTMTGSATANAEFGRLMVRASAAYDLTSPGTAATFASADVRDLLTIDAPGLTGTPGTLDVTYLLDGTISSSGAALALVFALVQWGGSEPFPQPDGAFELRSASTSEPVTVTVPFTFGDPFFLGMLMITVAGTVEECLTCPDDDVPIAIVPRTGPGFGTADFFSTMALTGLLPKDAAGVPVLEPVFSSSSGTRYSVSGVVPEPGSLLLLGTGLVLTARRWRRRRH